MFKKDLAKKVKTYSYLSIISGVFICVLFIVLTTYLSMNQYSYNIVNPNGSVTAIPYWPLIFLTILLGISWYSAMLSAYSVGEVLEKVNDFEKVLKREQEQYEKEQISEMIKTEKKKDEVTEAIKDIQNIKHTVVSTPENPVIVNKQLFDDDTITNTMEIENKLLVEDTANLPNYRLDLSNAFFDRIKPIKLTSEQERAVYENVEQALLTNDLLLLTTTTLEGQKVNINVPVNALSHVTDNIEALKDALKIFRKLQKIQIAKDFVWKT